MLMNNLQINRNASEHNIIFDFKKYFKVLFLNFCKFCKTRIIYIPEETGIRRNIHVREISLLRVNILSNLPERRVYKLYIV